MKYMPANRMVLGVFNARNTFEVVMNAMRTMTGQEEMPVPFQIDAQTPIAIGCGTVGPAIHSTVYIPNDLIRNITDILKNFGAIGGPPQGWEEQPMPEGEGEEFNENF